MAASPEGLIAVAYGYAVRELKYVDTDKGLAGLDPGLHRTAITLRVGPGLPLHRRR
jgi:hypothetical protein